MTTSSVSVIMPARNMATTIAESLRSVLDQKCLAEVIVVDDGSTDRTADAAIAVNDTRIRVIQGPCVGISAALNAGLEIATGDFIARCDADDLFLSGRLGTQVQWLSAHPDYVAMSGGFVSMNEKGDRLSTLACHGTGRNVSAMLQEGEVMTSLCTWLIRRTAVEAIGGARTWFQTAEDLDFQVRLAFEGDVWHEPEPVYGYRLHAASITHTRHAAQLAFFDDAVRSFAQERRLTGSDSLERGTPPEIPDFSGLVKDQKGLLVQVTGHMTSQAWKNFHAGEKRAALHHMLKAVRMTPSSGALWRGMFVMMFKLVFRRS